jgi:hypothetical protein
MVEDHALGSVTDVEFKEIASQIESLKHGGMLVTVVEG